MFLDKKMKGYLKGFVFPQTTLSEWLEVNKIQAGTLECANCGSLLNPLIPIASKEDRGVVYRPCDCGEMPPVTLVSASPQERLEDIQFFQLLSKELQ